MRLVEQYLAADPEAGAPLAAAPALAEALAGLLDELDEAGIDAAALDTLVEGDQAGAEHWTRTLRFVDIVRHAWPAIRAEAEGAAMDPKARQRAAVEALVAGWQAAPPPAPVIAAGSTGAVASTGALLAAVARLPGGAVVLPGLDPALPEAIWDRDRGGPGAGASAGPLRRVLGRSASRRGMSRPGRTHRPRGDACC